MVLRPGGVQCPELASGPSQGTESTSCLGATIQSIEKYCCCFGWTFCSGEIPRETRMMEKSTPRYRLRLTCKYNTSGESHTDSAWVSWETESYCVAFFSNQIVHILFTYNSQNNSSPPPTEEKILKVLLSMDIKLIDFNRNLMCFLIYKIKIVLVSPP